MTKKCYVQPQSVMVAFHAEPLMALSINGDGTVVGPDAEWGSSHIDYSEWDSENWYNPDDY